MQVGTGGSFLWISIHGSWTGKQLPVCLDHRGKYSGYLDPTSMSANAQHGLSSGACRESGWFASEEVQRSIKEIGDGDVWHTGNIRLMKHGKARRSMLHHFQFFTMHNASCRYLGIDSLHWPTRVPNIVRSSDAGVGLVGGSLIVYCEYL